MMRILGAVAGALVIIVALCVFLWPSGTKARLDVAGEKVVDTIDSLIGKTEVAQKDIDNRMKALEQSREGIRKAKVTAKVKSEMVGKQVSSAQENADRAKAALAKLDPHLKGKCSCTPPDSKGNVHVISGDTYTSKEVADTAARLVTAFKSSSTQADTLGRAVTTLNDVAKNLESKQVQAGVEYEQLQGTIAELKAKTIALRTMKDSAKAMGGNESDTFAGQVSDLKTKVNDLLVSVDTNLKVEQEQWDESATNKDMNKADRLIGSLTTNTSSEVDKILGSVEPTTEKK